MKKLGGEGKAPGVASFANGLSNLNIIFINENLTPTNVKLASIVGN